MKHRIRSFSCYCRLAYTSLVLALIVWTGCTESLESTVSGQVTLDSKPIGPGVVTFAPVDRKTNPAVGAIQPNGEYSLKTSRLEGLAAGRYQVAVTVFEQPVGTKPGERIMIPSKLLTPQQYASVETSGLEYEVEPGSNTIDIPLVSNHSGS